MAHANIDLKEPIRRVTVKRSDFKKIVEADPLTSSSDYPDVGYPTDQSFSIIRAGVQLVIPLSDHHAALQAIETPGLHGIDYESAHDKYGDDVYAEECYVLETILRALGVLILD